MNSDYIHVRVGNSLIIVLFVIFDQISMSSEDSAREDNDRGASRTRKAWKAEG